MCRWRKRSGKARSGRESSIAIPIPTYTWQRKPSGDFVLVDFNEASSRFTQGRIVELMGRTADQLFPDAPEIVGEISRCFREQICLHREMPHKLRTTGEFKQLDVTYVFLPPDLVMIHTEDITRRKKAEKALRESEQRLRVLAETAADAIVSADGQGNIIQFNRAGEQIFGCTADEVLGKPLMLLIPERYREACRRGIAAFSTTGAAPGLGKTTEVVGRRKDGSEVPWEVSLSAWKTPKGNFFTGRHCGTLPNGNAKRKSCNRHWPC